MVHKTKEQIGIGRVKVDLEASIITTKNLARDTIKKVHKDLKKYDKNAVMNVTKFEEGW